MSRQTLLPANLGDIHRSCHSLRLCLIPFWVACSRKGYSSGNHSFQFTGLERPTIPWGIPTVSRSWTCVALPSTFHSSGISSEGRVYDFLVDIVSFSLRPACTSVDSISGLSAREIYCALHHSFDFSHRLLLFFTRARLWQEVRVHSTDVHKFVLGDWGGGKLDRVFCCVLYCLAFKIPQ